MLTSSPELEARPLDIWTPIGHELKRAVDERDVACICKVLKEHERTGRIPYGFKDSMLEHAAETGQEEFVTALLEHGAKIDSAGTAVRLAAKTGTLRRFGSCWEVYGCYRSGHGRIATVRAMLDQRLDADLIYQCADCIAGHKNKCGRCRSENAIQLAAEYGHSEIVELLLSRGAIPKHEKNSKTALHRAAGGGRTPLLEAATHPYAGVFDLLLLAGCKIDDNEREWLPHMIRSKNSKALGRILPHLPSATFRRFSRDIPTIRNVLEQAVMTGDAAVTRLILDYAHRHNLLKDVDYKWVFWSATASSTEELMEIFVEYCPWTDEVTREEHIFKAVKEKARLGHLNAVLMLIEWHYEFGRNTPLLMAGFLSAIFYGQAATVQGLIEQAGAELNTPISRRASEKAGRGNEGDYPLHVAAHGGSAEVCEILFEYGADPNIREILDRTPLHSVWRGAAAQVLINYGADIEARDRFGHTAMHLAVTRFHGSEVITCLHTAGAALNPKDLAGKTPFHLAAKQCYSENYNCLLEFGADDNICDNKGVSARECYKAYHNNTPRGYKEYQESRWLR
ncbi:ankyrin repeat-containing domain protein [Aspergillus granulosus]|uniref:Ankyrin repeat-containing domain protein n=1 Tax=Aspergillus granulosus TaxID=176169 RepID=A0ABR4H0X5_9EURO